MKKHKAESTIQGEILEYLSAKSYVRKVITANKSGTLDIIGCFHGLFYSLEVKRQGEGASTLQAVNIMKIRENGGLAFVVTSLDEVKKSFEKLEKDMNSHGIISVLNNSKCYTEIGNHRTEHQ